jgi:hypothetical protein
MSVSDTISLIVMVRQKLGRRKLQSGYLEEYRHNVFRSILTLVEKYILAVVPPSRKELPRLRFTRNPKETAERRE